MFIGYSDGVKTYRLWCLKIGYRRCIISRDVVFNEAEMAFKKIDDIGRNAKIFEEEVEQEEILVKVEHLDVELHNVTPQIRIIHLNELFRFLFNNLVSL